MMAEPHEGSFDLTRKAEVDQTEVQRQPRKPSLQEISLVFPRAPSKTQSHFIN